MSRILLLACFVGSVFCSHSANNYIESVLRTPFLNEINRWRLDPFPTQNFTTEYEDKIKIIGKVKGKADYFNGTLEGLKSVVRFTECQGPSYSFGTGHINCTLAFNYLHTSHNAKLKYGKMPAMNINAKANVTRILTFVDIAQDHGHPARIFTYRIQEMGVVQPKFTGLGALNKFMKVLEDGYKANVGAHVTNAFLNNVQNALNFAAGQVPMPLH